MSVVAARKDVNIERCARHVADAQHGARLDVPVAASSVADTAARHAAMRADDEGQPFYALPTFDDRRAR